MSSARRTVILGIRQATKEGVRHAGLGKRLSEAVLPKPLLRLMGVNRTSAPTSRRPSTSEATALPCAMIPRAVGAADGRTGAFWPSTGPAAKAQARAPSATALHAARTVTPLERPAKIFSGFLPNDLQKPVRGLIHSLDQAPDGYFTVGVAGFEPTTSSSRTKRAAKLRYTPVSLLSRRRRLL